MKTILIADDDKSFRDLIQITLQTPDIHIFQAADGDEALQLARQEHPELIVLDWRMPGKTGLEVAEALRRDPATADIAILMLTAMGQEEDRKQGLALGVQGYLIKPFSPLELLKRVQELCALTPEEQPPH